MTTSDTNTCAVDSGRHISAPAPRERPGADTADWSDVMPDSTPSTPDRKQISRRLRYEILRRDHHTCRYCGGQAPDVELHVDHVVPVSLGGTDDPSNLTTACKDCNAGKGSTSATDAVAAAVDVEAERWALAMRRAADLERTTRKSHDDDVGTFLAYWAQRCPWARLPVDVGRTISTFINNGMSIDDIQYAVDQTNFAGKHFRYFCGVCWRIIRDRQAIARDLLNGEERG